ncbi:hypothetical protein P7H17_14260 [Paenibacillus larvae]|nr:hypothetical protein [Paenibacillus larvae]
MRILNRTKRAALELAQQIEKASRQKLGEMSMDLGIDITGKIWFFEANSKPMKFDEPDIRKKSLERIIQYSMFLTAKQKEVDPNGKQTTWCPYGSGSDQKPRRNNLLPEIKLACKIIGFGNYCIPPSRREFLRDDGERLDLRFLPEKMETENMSHASAGL